MEFLSPAEQLLFSTVYIENRMKEGTSVGTGFLYLVELEDGRTTHWLVTNKHVLAGAESVTFRMIQTNGAKGPQLGVPASATIGANDLAAITKEHPDANVDVAILPFGGVMQLMIDAGEEPFFVTIPARLAMSEMASEELDAVEEVLFVGYPNGLYDSRNLTPVIRRGITATHPGVNYRGEPAFLIDASVFPGSSGSPVFILNQGTYALKRGDVIAGVRTLFLGVVAAVHVRQATGELVPLAEPVATTRFAFSDPLNLGIVYKAGAIDECVDHALSWAGVPRRSVAGDTGA